MSPEFTIDKDGVTIELTLDSEYERAIGEMLKDFEVMNFSLIKEKQRDYCYSYRDEPKVLGVRWRLTRKRAEENVA